MDHVPLLPRAGTRRGAAPSPAFSAPLRPFLPPDPAVSRQAAPPARGGGLGHDFARVAVLPPAAPIAAQQPIQRVTHPLEGLKTVAHSHQLDELQKLDPHGSLRNLIFEDTPAAQQVMERYRRGSETGEADSVMLKSILALGELHDTGWSRVGYEEDPSDEAQENRAKRKEEMLKADPQLKELEKHAGRAYDMKPQLAKAYGLSHHELQAVEGYTDANKDKPVHGDGTPNPRYMGADDKLWGPHKTGWNALGSAMNKIPSVGSLGLTLNTFRVTRDSTESQRLAGLEPGTLVGHGMQDMGMGQRHYTSTAISYNVHSTEKRVKGSEGVMAMEGRAGRFINPFGVFPNSVDGGEVLYPPGMYSEYQGTTSEGFRTPSGTYPVHRLTEVGRPGQRVAERHGLVDDKDFSTVVPREQVIPDKEEREGLRRRKPLPAPSLGPPGKLKYD